jgi:ParB family chromosome partitioning protein
MTIQSLPLSSILPPEGNPRTAIDPAGIESLAASIQADGLLQNLVVVPLKGRKPRYRLISGERRYQALKLLEERGALPKDYAVPVDIRSGLSADDRLRLATVENVQRENLTPLEEASAFTRLMQEGLPLEELTAQIGLSSSTIKRRLALANLCDKAKEALAHGELTLAQAESLTLGSHEAQRDIVQRLADGHHYDADDIRDMLLDQRPSVALARFPLEQYQGTYTTDLFGEDDTTYFDDVEQFFALQRQAVAALAEAYVEKAEWVEVTEHYSIPRWHYRAAEDGATGGVVINLAPSGEVEVLEGLDRHAVTASAASVTADTPLAPKPKPAYSEALCRSMAHHKSMAVQHLLLANPRKAREVAVLLLLGASDYMPRVSVSRHDCLNAFAQAGTPPVSYQGVEQEAKRLAAALDLVDGEESVGWQRLRCPRGDATTLYETLKTLSDEDLDRLHLLLTVLAFGQGDCSRLDTGDTLFNHVARDLGADMRAYWRPDAEFLSRRTRTQLEQIVHESGLDARLGHQAGTTKKAELVRKMVHHFTRVHDLSNPADNDLQARDWLPDAMRFPAVDPAAQDDTGAEADDETFGEDALAA